MNILRANCSGQGIHQSLGMYHVSSCTLYCIQQGQHVFSVSPSEGAALYDTEFMVIFAKYIKISAHFTEHKPTTAQQSRNSPSFKEPEDLLQSSLEPRSLVSNLSSCILRISYSVHFHINSHLRSSLPCGLFPSGFPTERSMYWDISAGR